MALRGSRSDVRLKECDPDLERLVRATAEKTDLIVICGHRGEAAQAAAKKGGHSRLDWPRSKHNRWPSSAVDIAPWPLDWQNIPAFVALADVVFATAKEIGVKVVWGGHWVKLKDFPHFELVA